MKRTLIWLVAVAMTVAGGLAFAQSYSGDPRYGNSDGNRQARAVRCESRRGSRNFCRIPPGSPVRLVRQLSRTACVRGRSWYATNSGIWVSNGCRADFAVGRNNRYRSPDPVVRDDHYADRSGRVIHCESTLSGRNYCGDSHSRYSMAGNRDPDCIEGRTWGTDSRGVWVSGDCDADFNGNPYDRANGNDSGSEEVSHEHLIDGQGRVIHCQSTADGRNYCGERDSRYVISSRDSDCIEGVTYGRDQRGTWVSGECDAQFTRDEDLLDHDSDQGHEH